MSGRDWLRQYKASQRDAKKRLQLKAKKRLGSRAAEFRRRYVRATTPPRDFRVALGIALTLFGVCCIFVLPRVDFGRANLPYLLSASAQVMAASFALTFAVVAIAASAANRLGVMSVRRLFADGMTVLMVTVFALGALVPLVLLGVPQAITNDIWARGALALVAFALLMLVPYFVHVGELLHPLNMLSELLPAPSDRDCIEAEIDEGFRQFQGIVSAAFRLPAYDYARAGLKMLADATLESLVVEGRTSTNRYLGCLQRIALDARDHTVASLEVLDVAADIGFSCAENRYFLYRDPLRRILLVPARRGYDTKTAEVVRYAVRKFMALAEVTALAGDGTFWQKGVPDFEPLVMDDFWVKGGLGVLGAYCVGLWRVATALEPTRNEASSDEILPRLKGVAEIAGAERVCEEWHEVALQGVMHKRQQRERLEQLGREWRGELQAVHTQAGERTTLSRPC